MLAKLFAIVLVVLPILGAGGLLLIVADRRGGVARILAITALFVAGGLIVALLSPLGSGFSEDDRIEAFIGAWGILFIVIGLLAMGGLLIGKLRGGRPKADDE